jgi:hypothetical protein
MNYDILCFSHLRWGFVYQRPQHLMNRMAVRHRVFFIEEPIINNYESEYYFEIYHDSSSDVHVITPHAPAGASEEGLIEGQRKIINDLLRVYNIKNYVSWYYSPMALAFSNDLDPIYSVYDCMDELSAFLFAPPALKQYEHTLFQKADLVFTGGNSLYQAKKGLHKNIFSFPSSIDKDHFHTARRILGDPDDQRSIPYPRIGFYGVIDERLDIALLDQLSALKPEWQFVLVGPTVKIDPATLPRRANVHYLGAKQYTELPAYLSGWDIAMMPFALNDSTKFISPTKTPEYLAGGKPVISPSIADVVSPYGEMGLVQIADTADEFIEVADQILRHGLVAGWLKRVDDFLADRSWEKTVDEMEALIGQGIGKSTSHKLQKRKLYV